MGYIRHEAIVVTSSLPVALSAAREMAKELELICTDIADSMMNGYASFMIIPDGSKEGWVDSNAGNTRRAEWKAWVRKELPYLDWAHVSYGGDEEEMAHMVDHNGIEPEQQPA